MRLRRRRPPTGRVERVRAPRDVRGELEPPGRLPGCGPAHQSYLICTTPRTGSWFLCHALEATGVAGAPSEFFYPRVVSGWRRRLGLPESASYLDYVNALLVGATTANGVFGAKLMWQYLPRLLAEVPRLDEAFPELRYVYLERADRAAQAVSFWRAERTQAWGVGYGSSEVPPYDFAGIRKYYEAIAAGVAGWRAWFEAQLVTPLLLAYDDVVADHTVAVHSVLDHLGIQADGIAMPRPTLARQADEVSASYRQRFVDELGEPACDEPGS